MIWVLIDLISYVHNIISLFPQTLKVAGNRQMRAQIMKGDANYFLLRMRMMVSNQPQCL